MAPSSTSTIYIWDTIGLVVFEVISGSFGTVFKNDFKLKAGWS